MEQPTTPNTEPSIPKNWVEKLALYEKRRRIEETARHKASLRATTIGMIIGAVVPLIIIWTITPDWYRWMSLGSCTVGIPILIVERFYAFKRPNVYVKIKLLFMDGIAWDDDDEVEETS